MVSHQTMDIVGERRLLFYHLIRTLKPTHDDYGCYWELEYEQEWVMMLNTMSLQMG